MDGQAALQAIDQLLVQQQQPKLKKIQRALLLGVWEKKSYATISKELGYDASYIKQVAAQLWKTCSDLAGTKVSKGNIRSILQAAHPIPIVDWGEAIDVPRFYGREAELQTLVDWISVAHCRLVGIFGFGGIGKTTLAITASQQVLGQFSYVVWRSLQQTTHPQSLIDELLSILTGHHQRESSLASLMQQLRRQRCLLILDNVESILEPGERGSRYPRGYEAYGQMFDRIADENHQSCLILTGREKPAGLTLREGLKLPVRSFQLPGLSSDAAQLILQDKGLAARLDQVQILVNYFSGNPIAIKIAATAIRNFYAGDIQTFLDQGVVFGDLWNLLSQQFARLSMLQKRVMYWLAINRESITPAKLKQQLIGPATAPQLLETLETLHERSLIESNQRGLTQQPVVMEYMTEQFIQQITQEIIEGELHFFKTHTIIEAQTQDHLRETQIQLILKPIAERLTCHFAGLNQLTKHLCQILTTLQHQTTAYTGYAAGNLINLLCYLQIDLNNFDFSHLSIRQAFLRNAILHNVDFRGSHFSQTVFTETFGDILGIAFSPDGQYLATSDNKGIIQVWNAHTLEQQLCCDGHQRWAWDVSFSPDGQFLASVGDDYLVRLWNATTGELLYIYTGHTRVINAVAFSPDSRVLSSAALDHTIRLWSVFPQSNPGIHTLTGHSGRIWSIAFSPDGQTLMSGSEDRTVRLWNVATGECYCSWVAHDNWVRSVAFSPDGKLIATSSYDCTIKIWSCPTHDFEDSPELLYILLGHQKMVSAVAFSPNGQQLVSGSFDRTIKLWDVAAGKCLKTFIGHHDRIWNVAFHPNGKLIGSGGDDHSTKLWDLELGRCTNTIVGYINSVLALEVSLDGRYIAAGSEDTSIRIWDMHTGQIVHRLHGHTNRIWSVRFSPAGKLLASSSSDYTIKLWDWQNEKCKKTLAGHHSWVWMVAFNATGQFLASSSYDQTIKIWDIATGECIQTLSGHKSAAIAVEFSPVPAALPAGNGQLLASSGFDGAIKLWNFQTGECLQSLQASHDNVWSVKFSSDGKWLVSSSYDRTVNLWDVSTGECLQTFVGHQGPVLKAHFTPDDRSIISASMDGTLKVWDVSSGECLHTLEEHHGIVYALDVAEVNLAKKGNSATAQPRIMAFSGGFDETIKAWDLETAECLRTWRSLRPYENMKIDQVQGLTKAQLSTLRTLGATS